MVPNGSHQHINISSMLLSCCLPDSSEEGMAKSGLMPWHSFRKPSRKLEPQGPLYQIDEYFLMLLLLSDLLLSRLLHLRYGKYII